MERTELASRILALPRHEQHLALRYFHRLVEERRALLPPKPIDPVELARRVGLDPDPWQVQVLRSSARRILLNCARQTGKSSITGVLAAYTAHYQPGSLVLLLSPTMRQSVELLKKVIAAHRALEDPVPTEAMSALRLELRNESRIISLPSRENTVRGYSEVNLLIVDEAARVENDLYPMLAISGGRLIALSTPFGTRGWWYEAWRSMEEWERYEVPAAQCPRITPEFLEEERRSLGEFWFRQEFECDFLAAETQAFDQKDIANAFDEEVDPWHLQSLA